VDATTSSPIAVVLAGGDLVSLEAVGPLPDSPWVVAADSGLALAEHLDLDVALVVGDMDSADPALLATAERRGVAIERHPVDKDATDLELALDAVVRHGGGNVLILGGGGGRFDHLLASTLLLASPRYASLRIEWRPDGNRIHVAGPGRDVEVRGRADDVVSLLPVGGDAVGVSTEGLAWPLRRELLKAGTTRGVSNRLLGTAARISVTGGALLVIHERNPS
jgi:thiamine pyrophosphokinase